MSRPPRIVIAGAGQMGRAHAEAFRACGAEVVAVVDRVRHRRYRKTVQRTTKLYAHDETNDVREGDRVRIAETRPMSRLKRWRVVEILEKAK